MVNHILAGNALEVLATLPAESVHCIVTSPPYFGLRAYDGVEPSLWDADPACAHEWAESATARQTGRNDGGRDIGGRGGNYKEDGPRGEKTATGSHCSKCGAWRGCLGNEPTVELYVAHMVAIFREARRVLRRDGLLFLNLGDSFAAHAGPQVDGTMQRKGSQVGAWSGKRRAPPTGYKPKDLLMVPHRVALALQADGWWVRMDNVWEKPNCMPDSCTDRPTRSHEYVFMLSRSARYWYDADAIREPVTGGTHGGAWRGNNKVDLADGDVRFRSPTSLGNADAAAGRNARSVWRIATKPYAGAHFAVMAPDVAARCILSGCPAGGVVLDPFMGAATTGIMAESLGRSWLGIEASSKYIPIALKRLEDERAARRKPARKPRPIRALPPTHPAAGVVQVALFG